MAYRLKSQGSGALGSPSGPPLGPRLSHRLCGSATGHSNERDDEMTRFPAGTGCPGALVSFGSEGKHTLSEPAQRGEDVPEPLQSLLARQPLCTGASPGCRGLVHGARADQAAPWEGVLGTGPLEKERHTAPVRPVWVANLKAAGVSPVKCP